MTLHRIAVAAHCAALACLAIAFVRRNDVVIEGASFNRAVGEDTALGAVTGGDVGPWLVAAAAFVVVGTAIFIVDRGAQRR